MGNAEVLLGAPQVSVKLPLSLVACVGRWGGVGAGRGGGKPEKALQSYFRVGVGVGRTPKVLRTREELASAYM